MRSAEQELFAGALHDMLSANALGAARRWALGDRSPGLTLWHGLAELGVTALAVPEEWGGLSASPLDLVIACEELGHHALPGPVPESLAAVPQLLATLGDERLCAKWLPGLADGSLIATAAMPPQLPYAADADVAGLVLLVDAEGPQRVSADSQRVVAAGRDVDAGARDVAAAGLWLAMPGARHPSVDPARSLFEVRGDQLLASRSAVTAAATSALHYGTLACAAQLHGAGRALLEASVRHVSQRTQFGRPVGAFQAVKHHLANVAISLEFARPLLDAAALALADGSPTARRDVSAAKIACADAAHRAARIALQVHGAIGYTQEHDLSFWLLKVRALVPAWGTQSEHRAAVMAALSKDSE
jgi:alkylation response protein AidB-like acyl-CoA dehydrogenase